MFNTLMVTLTKTTDEALKAPITDQIVSFISSPESVTLAQSWIDKHYIHTADAPDTKIQDLKEANLRSIIKVLFKSDHLANELKF